MSGMYTVESTEVHQYETIKRLICSGNNTRSTIVLDVHRHLFPCSQDDRVRIVFTDPIPSTAHPRHDDGDYCMNGNVLDDEAGRKAGSNYTIYASCGGLMMVLRSATDPNIQNNFAVCLRKCASLKK